MQNIPIWVNSTERIRHFCDIHGNLAADGFNSKYIEIRIGLHFNPDPVEKMFILGPLRKICGLRKAEAGQD
jgi:hypothetical protein